MNRAILRSAARSMRCEVIDTLCDNTCDGEYFGSACTSAATTYTWELNLWPSTRENELLLAFTKAEGREPRCQGKAVR